ncbi:MAG: adenosylcobinamide-GDP ribazoletransferase [Synergistaceae bacterium]|jgi:adenosylcobinamide-GDP ribazoletransferase|nr:adenosylcobinamide-GDP ribazoletransferase [Synergistaceae bacterium]
MNAFAEAARRITEYAERFAGEVRLDGFAKELLNRFLAVWTLITRIPLPGTSRQRTRALPSADAMTMIPVAGGLFGILAALPAWIISAAAPPVASAWIACAIYTVLGWSLHLDGWGDLWDGVGSGARGDALRAVMKDSRVGAFGVAGIAFAIAIRAALIGAMEPGGWISACAVAGGVGRFGANVTVLFGKYPWKEGMGRDIVRNFKGYQLFCSFLAACFLFPFAPLGWTAGMILSGAAGASLAYWAGKNLGGVNGDVIGASAVLCELLVLLACSV